MDLSKLSSQLVKEAEKNPVKAGALGVLTLVALWFWAPLVWGWIRPADSVTPEVTPEAAATASITPAASPAGPIVVPLDWQGLLRARRSDPRMAVAAWKEDARDPFVAVKPPAKPVEEKPAEAIVVKPTVIKSLGELNIVLQGVMLGRKTKSATISGFTLAEGTKFAIDSQGKFVKKVEPIPGETLTIIELREVRATEVVLASEGKEHVLPLRKRSASGGTIEITRAP